MKPFGQWLNDFSKEVAEEVETQEEIDTSIVDSLASLDEDYDRYNMPLNIAVDLLGPNLAGGTCSDEEEEESNTDEASWRAVFGED